MSNCIASIYIIFFLNHTATPHIYTLSLHDALPIYQRAYFYHDIDQNKKYLKSSIDALAINRKYGSNVSLSFDPYLRRSEEHTSELQSLRHLVCRLLLEKKKKQIY